MHYYPDVSLTAQRRLINVFSSFLVVVAGIIFVLVTSRKLSIKAPQELGFVERAVWNLAPAINPLDVKTPMITDEGQSTFATDLEQRLHTWVMESQHSTKYWMVMVPETLEAHTDTRRIQKGRSHLHTRRLMVADPPYVPNRGNIRSEINPLKQTLLDTIESNNWPKHVLHNFAEVHTYINYFQCNHIALMSINPMNATKAEIQLLAQTFAWNKDCTINMFPLMKPKDYNEALQHKYEALVRAMYLIVSRSISTIRGEIPWIFLLGHLTALSNKQVSLHDIITRVKSASSRAPNQFLNPEDSDFEISRIEAKRKIDLNEEWRSEKGVDTIEKLMCSEKSARYNANISCSDVRPTPYLHQLAYIGGTRALCQFKYGPHLETDIQLFRPSPLGALMATAMRQYFRMRTHHTNESLALARIFSVLTGLRPTDLVGVCRAREDNGRNTRRWREACEQFQRFVASRYVDPRRFSSSGTAENLFSFGHHSLSQGEAVFVHEEEHEEDNHVALQAVQAIASFWLHSTSQGAFRFFDGEVSSSDWLMDGPPAVAWGCGAWLAGSGCTHRMNDFDAWHCGDFGLSFTVCDGDTYMSSEFRDRLKNDETCASVLPIDVSSSFVNSTVPS